MSWSFDDWYAENKRTLAAKRRERYKKDPNYRERCKENARKYYHRVKKRAKSDHTSMVDQKGRRLYTISWVAKVINRSTFVAREYFRTGGFPQPTYYDKRGWRLFTADQLNVLARAFQMYDDGRMKSIKEVAEYVRQNWD